MTWVKSKKADSVSSKDMSIDKSESAQDIDEGEIEEEEEEDDEEETSQLSQENPNKGKNLRNMLNNLRNKPTKPIPPKSASLPIQEESSGNESDQAYNSDTFGNERKLKTKFDKDGTRSVSKPMGISDMRDAKLSEIDSVGEEEEDKEDNNEITKELFEPEAELIKNTKSKSFVQLQRMIKKAANEIAMGKFPSIATQKAQMMQMCSEKEMGLREQSRELSVFELDPDNNDLSVLHKEIPPQVKPEWAIKKYGRSAADVVLNDPLTIRPIPMQVLILDYMIEDIADADRMKKSKFYKHKKAPNNYYEINHIIFDRTRSIRQELTVIGENMCKGNIQMLEKIARFHCLASNEGLDLENFSAKQNNEQFTSTLTMLRESYDNVREKLNDPKYNKPPSDEVYLSPVEGEFRAYMILTQMDNKLEVLETIKSLQESVRKSKEVQLAIKIFHAYQNNNIEKYFKLFRKSPYLIS